MPAGSGSGRTGSAAPSRCRGPCPARARAPSASHCWPRCARPLPASRAMPQRVPSQTPLPAQQCCQENLLSNPSPTSQASSSTAFCRTLRRGSAASSATMQPTSVDRKPCIRTLNLCCTPLGARTLRRKSAASSATMQLTSVDRKPYTRTLKICCTPHGARTLRRGSAASSATMQPTSALTAATIRNTTRQPSTPNGRCPPSDVARNPANPPATAWHVALTFNG